MLDAVDHDAIAAQPVGTPRTSRDLQRAVSAGGSSGIVYTFGPAVVGPPWIVGRCWGTPRAGRGPRGAAWRARQPCAWTCRGTLEHEQGGDGDADEEHRTHDAALDGVDEAKEQTASGDRPSARPPTAATWRGRPASAHCSNPLISTGAEGRQDGGTHWGVRQLDVWAATIDIVERAARLRCAQDGASAAGCNKRPELARARRPEHTDGVLGVEGTRLPPGA
jgi:hypothetical protein